MNLSKLLLVPAVLFLIQCGPSKQDEVAANRGCRLAEKYERAYIETGASEAEVKQAKNQLQARVEGYRSGLEHANFETVKELIETNCPCKMEYIEKALQMYP